MSFVSFTPAARRDAPRAALVCACRSGPEGARVRAEGGRFPGGRAGTSPAVEATPRVALAEKELAQK